ncbi:ETX/MTX2 family pore-forming toxin [Enterococcus faecalis]|uniref:ETX/MTX2 family pore-forming toxin n=1 Tax=Enterococcus faecalis TaxID=1351 RepID=UPI0031CDADBE
MKKSFNLLLALLLLNFFSDTNAYAEKNTTVIMNTQLENSAMNALETENTNIINKLKPEVVDLCFSVSRNRSLDGKIEWSQTLNHHDIKILDNIIKEEKLTFTPQVRLNDDMSLKEGETIAAHQADLKNSTKKEQTLNTASFEYTQTDSISTKTSHSAGVSLTTSAEMKFPFVSGSMSMTAKYDFNSTKDIISTVTKKWIVPSQSIKVPAGKTYRVKWLLNIGTATGTTDLQCLVNGIVPLYWKQNTTNVIIVYDIGTAINMNKSYLNSLMNPFEWKSNSSWSNVNSKGIKKLGTSEYTAKLGNQLIMSIEDISVNRFAPVIVESIPMDIEPVILK